VTTTPVKPIETEYRGYRFRSRLEARWAVAFDAMGINWLYEPEGYMVNDRPYLPDFWLPDLGVWVEGTLSRGDLGRLVDAAGPDGLPLELGCGHRPRLEDPRTWGARILILGPIPDPKTASLHSMVWYFAGEVVTYWVNLRHRPDGRWQFLVIDAPRHTGDHWEKLDDDARALIAEGHQVDFIEPDRTVAAAYRAGRSARFEHGESGSPKPACLMPYVAHLNVGTTTALESSEPDLVPYHADRPLLPPPIEAPRPSRPRKSSRTA
jgi:hypothetical protein